MITYCKTLFASLFILSAGTALAQDSTQSCKVMVEVLAGKYMGKCKNGLADGKGEAIGLERYVGNFKNGLPNGKGTYYYRDSSYFTGNFQDALKEGKGEMHYLRNGADSLVKGYWSADEYRGKNYKTYELSSTQNFDITEITPSDESGNSITIEISTTSGSPNGTATRINGGSGYVLTINDLISASGDLIRKVSSYATANKSSYTYTLSVFPTKLFATLSNGQTISLELYKAARWTARFYLNR